MYDLSMYKDMAPYLSWDPELWGESIKELPEVSFEKKEIIRMQGSAEKDLFILRSGIMLVIYLLDDGSEIIQHYGGPGCVFGVVSTMTLEPYMTTALAVEPCTGSFLSAEDLSGIANRDSGIIKNIIRFEAARSKLYCNRLRVLSINNVRTRLLTVLLGFCSRIGKELPGGDILIPLRITHQHMSDMVNVDRATVSRILSSLAKEKAIRRDNGHYVLSPHRLGPELFPDR